VPRNATSDRSALDEECAPRTQKWSTPFVVWPGFVLSGGESATALCDWCYNLRWMTTWDLEIEREVNEWLLALDSISFEIPEAHIDLLAEYGSTLRMPHSRSLGDGLFELRFDLARRAWRITYWFSPRRVIVLLTVFWKQRNNKRVEVRRARAAMTRCQQGHPR
jgi:hypothetical protein